LVLSCLIPTREVGVVWCVAMMAFTFQFESALVAVSLPDVARELSVSASSVSVVLLSYLVGAVIAFIPAGKLGDRYGLRIVCLAGCVLAASGTILCGVAQSIEALVAGRLIQGIGAGGFVAAGYAMIPTWVSPERVGWGYGMQSLGAGVGMVAGVPAGGLLSNFLTWQWIFLASVPIFTALLAVAWSVLPGSQQQALARGADIRWGPVSMFAALMVGITFILCGGPVFGWTSPLVLIAFGGCLVLMAGLWIADRAGSRLFSRQLFSSMTTVPAFAAMFLMAAVAGGVRYVLPFYLEIGCGLSILMSSYLLLVHPLFYAPVSLVAGRLSDWLGSRSIVLAATSLGIISTMGFALALSRFEAAVALAFMAAFGMATGLFFAPANRLIMAPIPKLLRGEAGGALSVVFNLGTLLGVAVFQLLLTWPSAGIRVPEAGFGSGSENGELAFGFCFALGGLLGILALLCAMQVKVDKPSAVTPPPSD
jgi:DHA2 family multidrug resistance protein-like MFS transporter